MVLPHQHQNGCRRARKKYKDNETYLDTGGAVQYASISRIELGRGFGEISDSFAYKVDWSRGF